MLWLCFRYDSVVSEKFQPGPKFGTGHVFGGVCVMANGCVELMKFGNLAANGESCFSVFLECFSHF